MATNLSKLSIPPNSISCYIGRICKVDDNFQKNGILYVDFYDLDGSKKGPEFGEDGSTQHKVIASWTLRAAYCAWNFPPKIHYYGKITGAKGKIKLTNANLSQVTISGGPPLQGTTTCGMGPGTSVTPVAISNASGTATIQCDGQSEINFTSADTEYPKEGDTKDDNLTLELTSQIGAQLPWCVDTSSSNPSQDVIKRESDNRLIIPGDKALCMAFGNSFANLYCVDIFK